MTDAGFRFGVIGCGGMATQVHCPNMTAIKGAQTVAYCDVDLARAEALFQQFGGDYATTDASRIFGDDSLDGVLIQTGERWHPQLVQGAAKAGKAIFCEKPIAVHLADALETVRVVEDTGVRFQFGTCNRLAATVQMAKRMCPDPLYSYCQCTDTVSGQAVHNLDMAVNLFHEAGLQTVYASGGQHYGLDLHLPADSFSAVLTFTDQSVHTYIQHGKAYNPLLLKYHYQLFGQDRCVYLAKRFKECHLMRSRTEVEATWCFEGPDTYRGEFGYMGHYDELKELVNCMAHGGKPQLTIRDAAYVLAVEKAILQSIVTGQVIDFQTFLAEQGAAFLLEGRGA
jgi:predicted dehydrogenase